MPQDQLNRKSVCVLGLDKASVLAKVLNLWPVDATLFWPSPFVHSLTVPEIATSSCVRCTLFLPVSVAKSQTLATLPLNSVYKQRGSRLLCLCHQKRKHDFVSSSEWQTCFAAFPKGTLNCISKLLPFAACLGKKKASHFHAKLYVQHRLP